VCLQFGCLVVDIPEDLQAEQVTLPERSRCGFVFTTLDSRAQQVTLHE
jgi:hypothetical protein